VTPLFREHWYPLAGGLLAAVLWGWLNVEFPGPEAARDLYATTVSLASITVGFLATAMSIVVSTPDGPLVAKLASSGYLRDLIRYLREPFLVGLFVCATCLAGFILPPLVTQKWVFGATWSGATVWMLLGLVRIGVIFVRLLSLAGKAGLGR